MNSIAPEKDSPFGVTQPMLNFDRKLALGFGTLVLILMIVVSLAGAGAYQRIARAQEKLLSTALAGVLSESINRTSFSGRYHTRLLLEEIVKNHPQLAYLYVANLENTIIAHSDPTLNDSPLPERLKPDTEQVRVEGNTLIQRRVASQGATQEIVMPYYAGYERETAGVIVVGITLVDAKANTTTALLFVAILILCLTVLSLIATYLMSTRLASPVRHLALKLQGILDHAPMFIGIYDQHGTLEQASSSTTPLLDRVTTIIRWPFLTDAPKRFQDSAVVHSEETSFRIGQQEGVAAVTTFPIVIGPRAEAQLWCSIAMDITEQRAAEAELRQHRDHLEEMVTERTQALELSNETIRQREAEIVRMGQLRESLLEDINFAKKYQRIVDCAQELLRADFTGIWLIPASNVRKAPDTERPSTPAGAPTGSLLYLEAFRADQSTALPIDTAPEVSNLDEVQALLHNEDAGVVSYHLDGNSCSSWSRENGFTTFAGIVLRTTEGEIEGVLGAYTTSPLSPRENAILDDLGNTTTYIIQAQRTLSTLEDVNRSLLHQERLATLGQLTATVSHELRNPLGTIRASIFMMERELATDDREKVRRALERANRSIQRCDRIIEELLHFTRKADLHLENTPLGDWVREEIKSYAFPETVLVDTHIDDDVMVVIDRQAVYQCLANLLNNACDALGENEGEARQILISVTRAQERVLLSVRDSGPGIPEDVIPHIFEPLYSTKGFGTGLGLPLVQKLMGLHGGSVHIVNNDERGTCATLTLPCIEDAER